MGLWNASNVEPHPIGWGLSLYITTMGWGLLCSGLFSGLHSHTFRQSLNSKKVSQFFVREEI